VDRCRGVSSLIRTKSDSDLNHALPHFCTIRSQGIELGHVSIVNNEELFVPSYNSPVCL